MSGATSTKEDEHHVAQATLDCDRCGAAVLAFGLAACGGGDDDDGHGRRHHGGADDTAAGGGGRGKTVKIIASVPPTDHGWLGAISKNAKEAADAVRRRRLQLLEAADADSQAQQIEQAISQKPDALVVLPQDGAALTPVAQKAEQAGIPVVNIDRLFTDAGRGDAPRSSATTTRSACWRRLHRRPARSARATSSRSRASPASR